MPKGKEKHNNRSIVYIKAASLNDICRFVFNFDFTSRSLIYSKGKLMAFGETIGAATLAYYVNASAESSFISYKFPSASREQEMAHFMTKTDENNKNMINVLQLDLSYMKEAKNIEKNTIDTIKVSAPEDLFNAVIKRAVKEDAFMYAYSFMHGKTRYICAFDILEELQNEKRIFYYSPLKNSSTASFARYKYTDNTFEFTEAVEEHSYIYVKIINLAEPFQFFKPD